MKFSLFVTIIYVFILQDCSFGISDSDIYNGPIAGNKTISQCINGQRHHYTELEITTSEFIRKEGYPAEDHVVVTEDGYLLTIHRIPGRKSNAPTVFLQHGVLLSSFDWVVYGKNKSLAFILADKGYDVWMGNARGSLYSRCHTKYSTDDYRYWNFSFHQVGVYDLPTQIKYIEKIKSDKYVYVGHSMGTTEFYVFASERPDIASKFKAMFSLAPVSFLDYTTSPLRFLVPFRNIIEYVVRHITKGEFLSQSRTWKYFVDYGCDLFSFEAKICTRVISLFFEIDPTEFDYEKASLVLNHFPAGTSTRTILHYGQIRHSRAFQKFDFGSKGNLEVYNSVQPPNYNLSNIQVPIGVLWSESDGLGNPKDVKHLYDSLPKKLVNYKVPYPKFDHLDFVWGLDAKKLVYEFLITFMTKFI